MDRPTEEKILSSPEVRNLVGAVLCLCEGRDPVDAIADLELVLYMLKRRLARREGERAERGTP